MKKALLIVGITLSAIAVSALCILCLYGLFLYDEWKLNHWYQTEDISEYMVISHNGQNDVVEEFVSDFFPEQLEPYFESVRYEYRARDYCEYCCEMSLAFTIEDKQTYENYVASITQGLEKTTFAYDEALSDYVVCNELTVEEREPNGSGNYYLSGARIGRILTCDEQQSITFSAIMVTLCCGTDTDNLHFFSDYAIDPLAYAIAKT